jgi:putative membrane protein
MIVSVVIGILLYALSIWVVGRLKLGLKVSGFAPAFIAAIIISIVSSLIVWLGGALGLSVWGFLGAIVHLIIAALVLMFAGNMVKGLKVDGFAGAVIAAVAIAVVSWLINGVVGLFF